MSATGALRCDVAVVGGGSAGIGAALGAARAGAHVVLIERSDRLGGNAAHALVHTICGLYLPAESGDARLAHAGVARELAARLAASGGAGAPEKAGRAWYLPMRPDAFSRVATELCRAESGLELLLGAELCAARSAGGWTLLVRAGAVEREVEARVAIDASGDAALTALAGAAFDQAEPELLQCPSYVFRLEGVDTARLAGFARVQLTTAVAGATRRGALPLAAESVVVRASGAPGEVFVTLNVARPVGSWRPLDAECVGALERAARATAEAIALFLRASRPGFEASRLAEHPRRLGIRETRRGRGAVVLTRDDVLAGRRRDDEVAVSTWPIELWHDHRRPTYEFPSGPCSVPLGALVSGTHARLGFAGRCASATHEALGALRVIGTSLATGEAIGRAAALAADGGNALLEIAPAAVRAQILG